MRGEAVITVLITVLKQGAESRRQGAENRTVPVLADRPT